MSEVKGKIVLITGGALGMGREVARLFARDGARIVLWDLRQEDLNKTAEELKALGAEIHTYICDVTNRQTVYETADKVRKEVGVVDILDNNAGVVFGGEFLEVP
ncbi:MAG: SDR family NAD(P)-dependent oxidoreductase, partial [Deltaproteobacteria bacterium]